MNDGEGPGSQHAGQLGPVSGAMGMMTKQQADDVGQRPQYSMPGILHFLQTEWARFEMERSQWEVERAELQVNNLAFLFHYLYRQLHIFLLGELCTCQERKA